MNGIYHKYDVYNASSGERIQDCFVLRPNSDQAAVYALRAYAKATENRGLAEDIIKWVGEGAIEPNRVLTMDEARAAGVCWYEENTAGTCIEAVKIMNVRYDTYTLQGVDVRMELFGKSGQEGALRNRYGKTWRCWMRKPTAEERAAAPWEVKTMSYNAELAKQPLTGKADDILVLLEREQRHLMVCINRKGYVAMPPNEYMELRDMYEKLTKAQEVELKDGP